MLPEPDLQRWRDGLAQRASSIAQQADHWSDSEASPSELVRRYLADPVLAEAFGGPAAPVQLPVSRDYHALWLTSSWGRRCGHYLAMFSQGLKRCATPDQRLHDCADRLASQAQRIRAYFKPKRFGGTTVLASLQAQHGVMNFHQSHLDAELFSALIMLLATENSQSPEWSDLGITSEDEERFVRDGLLEIIRREIAKYAGDSQTRSPLLVDESTLWWGVSELIRRDGQSFYLEEGGDSGPVFASRFVEKLAKWTLSSPACPDFFVAVTEGTPEIHCALRTHLLLVMNALNLLVPDSPMSASRDATKLLEAVRDQSLETAKACWDDEPELQKHAYFIGLTLDVLSQLLPTQHPFSNLRQLESASLRDADLPPGPFLKKTWQTILNISQTVMYRREKKKELCFIPAHGRRGYFLDWRNWGDEHKYALKRDIDGYRRQNARS